MSEHPCPPGPPGAVWTAATVARRLGVAPETLRSWSRRYGIGPAGHSPGRHRRYTDADVAEVDAFCALVARGMVLSAAAAVVHHGRTTGSAATPAPGEAAPGDTAPGDTVAGLVRAAAALDVAAVSEIVAGGLAAHGVVDTWERLCRPAFDELDSGVTEDRGCADSHLVLSWVVGTCLRRPVIERARSGDRPVLLACPAGEQHTLGLDALSAALVERGVPARMLGPAVPAAALRHAALRLRPAAVVVWAQRSITARPGVLRGLAPPADAVLAAGPGWREVPLPATVSGVDSLREALAVLAPESNPDRRAIAPSLT